MLVVKDDVTTVVIEVGANDAWVAAIRAAESLGDVALAYAARLRAGLARRRAQIEAGEGRP